MRTRGSLRITVNERLNLGSAQRARSCEPVASRRAAAVIDRAVRARALDAGGALRRACAVNATSGHAGAARLVGISSESARAAGGSSAGGGARPGRVSLATDLDRIPAVAGV